MAAMGQEKGAESEQQGGKVKESLFYGNEFQLLFHRVVLCVIAMNQAVRECQVAPWGNSIHSRIDCSAGMTPRVIS